MSFKAFMWAWDQSKTVPNPDHHHVLLALANIAPVRELFASVPYIASMCNRSPRKVRSALQWMEAAGVLTLIERPGKTDLIRMNIPASFVVVMDDELNDIEKGTRGRPRKTPTPCENPSTEEVKPLSNPCIRGADEPIEPKVTKTLSDESLPTVTARPASSARQAFDAWNEFAGRCGKAKAQAFTESRRGHLNARISDAGGLTGFLDALKAVETSDFLMGRTSGRHGPFAISLDMLLQPTSFTRLLEGFYHRRGPNGGSTEPTGSSPGRSAHDQRNASMLAGLRAAFDGSGQPGRGADRGD